MLISKKYVYLGWILLMTCAALYFYSSLKKNPPGYCKAEERYISDEEYIGIAISMVRKDIEWVNPKKGDSSFYADWEGYVPEIGDLDCCKVNRTQTLSIFNRLFGLQTVKVLVVPKLKPNSKSWPFAISFFFDVCGSLKSSDISSR